MNYSQGRPGDKGQKGELGSPGFDVFSAVKVSTINNGDSIRKKILLFGRTYHTVHWLTDYYSIACCCPVHCITLTIKKSNLPDIAVSRSPQ